MQYNFSSCNKNDIALSNMQYYYILLISHLISFHAEGSTVWPAHFLLALPHSTAPTLMIIDMYDKISENPAKIIYEDIMSHY